MKRKNNNINMIKKVQLIKSGVWYEQRTHPIDFNIGDIYDGPDWRLLIQAKWAAVYKDSHMSGEHATHQTITVSVNHEFINPGVRIGETVDTMLSPKGLYFTFFAAWHMLGVFNVSFQHAKEKDGPYEDVPIENLVYGSKSHKIPILAGPASIGDYIGRESFVGAKRYIRPIITAAEEPRPKAQIVVLAVHDHDEVPTPSHMIYDVPEKSEKADVNEVVKDTSGLRDMLEKMVGGIESDSEAKDKLAEYAEDEFGFKVNRRKSVANIIDNIVKQG